MEIQPKGWKRKEKGFWIKPWRKRVLGFWFFFFFLPKDECSRRQKYDDRRDNSALVSRAAQSSSHAGTS